MDEMQKLFQEQLDLFKQLTDLDDSFKLEIINEPDAEKHSAIFARFEKNKKDIEDKRSQKLESLNQKAKDVYSPIENPPVDPNDNNGGNGNNEGNGNKPSTILDTFRIYFKNGLPVDAIAAKFKEEELIQMGLELNLIMDKSSTKRSKVLLIISVIEKER